MSAPEQFARAFLTLRSTFGGGAALKLWDRFAGDASARKAKGDKALKAAFEGAWGDAAKAAETKKGKVGGV